MAATVDWIQHINSWQSSGLSQAAYCRQQGLNYKTFTVRLSAFRQGSKNAQSDGPTKTALIPVQVPPPLSTEAIRLITEQGHRLELPPSIGATWLAELLRCLG